jgi:hypothetical protein
MHKIIRGTLDAPNDLFSVAQVCIVILSARSVKDQ